MVDFIQHLIHWIHLHPHWAAIICFLIAFGESVAIIGLFVPGSTILAMVGGLIGAQILPPTAIIIFSVLGAIAGDGLSYWLGHHYHQHIRSVWPFSKFNHLFYKGEKFFIKHGGKSVFMGRFLGPLRPVLPMIAGMMNLKPSRFFTANILSALIWAPGYILLGVIIGNHIVSVSPHHAARVIAEITAILLVLWVLYWLVRGIILKYIFKFNEPLQRKLNTMERSVLHHHQNWLAIGTIISGIAFLLLFALIISGVNVMPINLPLHKFLLGLHNPLTDTIMLILTLFGEKMVIMPIAVLVFIYFIFIKQYRLAIHWAALMIITVAAFTVFKDLAHFPRPTDLAIVIKESSFPSGHVGFAVVFWGFLAFIFAQQFTDLKHRLWAEAIASLIVITVAFSRIYLGVHWLTDVIGSILLGLTCLGAVIWSYRYRVDVPHIALRPLALLVACGFALLSCIFLYKNFLTQYNGYQPAPENTFMAVPISTTQ